MRLQECLAGFTSQGSLGNWDIKLGAWQPRSQRWPKTRVGRRVRQHSAEVPSPGQPAVPKASVGSRAPSRAAPAEYGQPPQLEVREAGDDQEPGGHCRTASVLPFGCSRGRGRLCRAGMESSTQSRTPDCHHCQSCNRCSRPDGHQALGTSFCYPSPDGISIQCRPGRHLSRVPFPLWGVLL